MEIETKYLGKILELQSQLEAKSNRFKTFNPYRWVQQNSRGHPKAIIKTLDTIFTRWKDIDSPDGWANAVFKIENGKFNAEDAETAHKQLQNEWAAFAKSEQGQKIAGLLGENAFEMPEG